MAKGAIITGAAGFLGTALCRELLEHGYEVTAVIRPGSPKRRKIQSSEEGRAAGRPALRIVEMDLPRISRLEKLGLQADLFYHLAWSGSSGDDRNRFECQYENIRYTVEAIRAAKKCGCKKFIGAGSQAEYGVVRKTAEEDGTVPHPFTMYGAAKLAAYHTGKLAAQQEDIAFVWPRIYSVYGPGENPGTLVSYVIDTLRQGKVPQVTDCENLWDFTYIDDCAGMLRTLGEHAGAEGICNLSAGEPRKLRAFVEEIRDLVAPGAEIAFGAKEADPERTFWLDPDVGRIRELGIKCGVSFEEGIRRRIERK